MASVKGGKGNFVKQYVKIEKDHRLQFGIKTIVLMQKGHFYELYSLTDELVKVCDMLNILITRANKKGEQQITIDNPYMAGFQVSSADRFIKILLDNNYTVVIVDEIHKYDNEKRTITREVTRIVSPSTNIESSETVPLMCIFVDKTEMSITWADLSTGKIGIFTETSYDLEKIKNIVSNIKPKEIVIYSDTDIQIDNQDIIKYKYDINPLISKISFQNEFLDKIYNNKALGISPIENIKLERFPLASTCLVYLLQFVLQHDKLILTNLQIPHIMNLERTVNLSENCITQLNLDQLIKFIDNNSTPMGSRLLRYKILNPYIKEEDICKSYNSVKTMLKDGVSNYKAISFQLKCICDLDKYNRKINTGRLSHMELIKFYNCLEHVSNVISTVYSNQSPEVNNKFTSVTNNISKLSNEIYKTINLDFMETIFKNTHNKQLDELVKQKKDLFIQIENIKSEISKDPSVLDTEKVNGVYMYNIKRKNLKCILSDKAEIKNTKSQCRISCKKLDDISQDLIELEDHITDLEKEEYNKFLINIGNKYTKTINKASSLIAEVDNFVSCCILMENYKFVIPDIDKEKADLQITGMRHPLIESQISNEYTPNNLSLNKDLSGMLLYGLNFSGKTSYIRTVGICVILAQAGFPVPVEQMSFKPFSNIITKISLGDNLNRNQSTFTNEIKEIKRMIDCSSANSIILADELCSGTEINSALSLVSATILHLANNNCKFIFTTHYHQLIDIPQIKNLNNVKPFHMKVDIQNGKLVFNRTLQPGKCMDNYGIEIAQFMKMPMEFIHLANTIRDNLTDNYVVGKVSRYNSNIFMTDCKICGSKKDLHTHHIIFQSQMITKEKNYKNNLVVLCEECHHKVHKGVLDIQQYIETCI